MKNKLLFFAFISLVMIINILIGNNANQRFDISLKQAKAQTGYVYETYSPFPPESPTGSIAVNGEPCYRDQISTTTGTSQTSGSFGINVTLDMTGPGIGASYTSGSTTTSNDVTITPVFVGYSKVCQDAYYTTANFCRSISCTEVIAS